MGLFRHTRYWKSQVAGFCALVLLITGLTNPLTSYDRMLPSYTDRISEVPISRNGEQPDWASKPIPGWMPVSALSAPVLTFRILGFLLLISGLIGFWLVLQLQFNKLTWVTAVISSIATALVAYAIILAIQRPNFTLFSTMPYEYLTESVGWAWLPLFISLGAWWLSARWESAPTAEELEELSRHKRRNEPTQIVQDIGQCVECSARNSLKATRCHVCGHILPWEAARQKKAAHARNNSTAYITESISISGIPVNILLTGLLGFFIFWLCAIFPPAGYFAWRLLDHSESKYAGAAFLGWIFGAIVVVGGFLLRLLLTMSRVGTG